jgi:hypothetical protein
MPERMAIPSVPIYAVSAIKHYCGRRETLEQVKEGFGEGSPQPRTAKVLWCLPLFSECESLPSTLNAAMAGQSQEYQGRLQVGGCLLSATRYVLKYSTPYFFYQCRNIFLLARDISNGCTT